MKIDMKKTAGYAVAGAVGSILSLCSFAAVENHSFSLSNPDRPDTTITTNASLGITPPDFTVAASKTVDAVVNVKNYSNVRQQGGMMDPFEFFFGQGGSMRKQQEDNNNEPQKMGHGSGVIISADGYIVTNNHVIKDAQKIEVTLNDQRTYTAKLVGKDETSDIALLKIDATDLTFLPFSNSDNVKVGEWVLAVGNPFSLNSTVTAGIVSAIGRSLNMSGVESFIQTDAAINPGNSGGALVNTEGELIGINSAISSQTGSYIGYGFAIPTNIVKKIIDDIKKYGFVQRAYIGIKPLDLTQEDDVDAYNKQFKTKYKVQKGVLIYDFVEDGAAASAGLQKGDIITKIDDKEITNFASLTAYLNSKNPGDKVKITVMRDEKAKEYDVVLKDQYGKSSIRTKDELTVSETLGIELGEVPASVKKQFGIDYGVQVVKIRDGKFKQAEAISEGDIILSVNQQKVSSPKDVDKILKGYSGEVSVVFLDQYGRRIFTGFEMD